MNADDEHDLQESYPDLETIMEALTGIDPLEPMEDLDDHLLKETDM